MSLDWVAKTQCSSHLCCPQRHQPGSSVKYRVSTGHGPGSWGVLPGIMGVLPGATGAIAGGHGDYCLGSWGYCPGPWGVLPGATGGTAPGPQEYCLGPWLGPHVCQARSFATARQARREGSRALWAWDCVPSLPSTCSLAAGVKFRVLEPMAGRPLCLLMQVRLVGRWMGLASVLHYLGVQVLCLSMSWALYPAGAL